MQGIMKSLVAHADGSLSIESLAIPNYAATEALVKIEACGICNGTDAKIIHGQFKGIGLDQYPVLLGHEAVGIVVETGSAVKSYKVGDRVLLPYNDKPMGGYGSAWGAFSEYAIVRDRVALLESGVLEDSPDFPENCNAQNVVSADMDPAEAVVIITLREVLAAIRYFGIRENDSVAVFGCGPVGAIFIRFLHLLGVGPIFAIDHHDEKLASAGAAGADYTFNNAKQDCYLREQVRRVCPRGVRFAIDAAGSLGAVSDAMGLIADRGKICCYGIPAELSMQLDWTNCDYNWQLVFQQMPRKIEEQQATSQIMAWLEAGAIRLADFISDEYDFAHVMQAFEKLMHKEISKKCIVRF